MLKVLIVSGSLPPIRCGVGYYTARLSRELAKHKLEFEILSTQGVDQNVPAPLITVPNWKIRSLPKILEAIKRSEAKIVHIEYPAVGYRRQLGINLLPYVLRLFKPRLKIIITLHEYSQSRLIGRIRNRITIWPAHRVIVSNQVDKKRLGHKVVIIPIGASFDVAPRRPEVYRKILRSHKLDPSRPTIVFFGYAFPSKRLDILLTAMRQPELEDYQLLIFPGFDDKLDYHRKLKAKIAKLNATSPRVAAQGFLERADASAALQECKYMVLPVERPLSAKSSTAVAAIQNGLILISHGSRQADANLPYIHLKNCYLLDEISPASIAEAISRLDATPAELDDIRRGAEQLKKYFSWDNIARQHLKIYKELADD